MSAVVTGCLMLLAGCASDADPGQPDPGQPSSSAVSPIPPVDNPRDVATMARRTCELLTPRQAAGFGPDLPPEPSDGLFGTIACQWRSNAGDRRIGISLFTNNLTLETVYDRRESLPFFELTTVGGYPATVSRAVADLPICDIHVKPAELQSVTVSYRSDEFRGNPQQACVVGKQVAEAVVMNLPVKG
ncbi:MAG: DUF3558 domain-containing protein [Pseudonocardiales bacterium]